MTDAVRYLVDNGIKWRAMPSDFPPWPRVYAFFARWRDAGRVAEPHDRLREAVRDAEGRDREPSAAVIDSQSVKADATVALTSRGFEAEAGRSMNPPRARTWGRIGRTPVVRIRKRGSGRVPMAGTARCKPGQRSRLIYAIREYRGRRDEPKGFGRRDFRDLVVRARIQLGGPIVPA